jgi:hypothetical protein
MATDRVREALLAKVDHAEFHLEKLLESTDARGRAAYFSAFLSSVRSVALYVRTWLELHKRIRKGKHGNQDWTAAITNWEQQTLAAQQQVHWRAVTALRNRDIHEEPVIPRYGMQGGYWDPRYVAPGYWDSRYWAAAHPMMRISDPQTGEEFDLPNACSAALQVVRRLIDQHQTVGPASPSH